MGIAAERFVVGDVCIDYGYRQVVFRYEQVTRTFYRKFYDGPQEHTVPFDNGLLNEAIRFGDEITAEQYRDGKHEP